MACGCPRAACADHRKRRISRAKQQEKQDGKVARSLMVERLEAVRQAEARSVHDLDSCIPSIVSRVGAARYTALGSTVWYERCK